MMIIVLVVVPTDDSEYFLCCAIRLLTLFKVFILHLEIPCHCESLSVCLRLSIQIIKATTLYRAAVNNVSVVTLI